MKANRTPKNKCLDCGYVSDAASDPITGSSPKEGDISICINCGHIATFNADKTLRPLTDREIIEIAGNPTIIKIQAARGHVMANETEEKKDGKS